MLPTLLRSAKAHHTKAPSAAHTFKRAQQGLFGGKTKMFGNNVPESHQKTRRSWLPNIQSKNLYSATLNERIRIKVTTSALRDIDKVGGLDQYLLKPSFQAVLGQKGLQLKERILQRRSAVQAAGDTSPEKRFVQRIRRRSPGPRAGTA